MERWKDVPGYECYYQVSNIGRVRSVSRKVKSRGGYRFVNGRVLKELLTKTGYNTVHLSRLGIKKKEQVHQLVAMAFLGHLPNGVKTHIDHINHIKTDNRVENLQIVTPRINSIRRDLNNRSNMLGAHYIKDRDAWRSSMLINGKQVYLGYYKTELDAHTAYINKLKELK